MTEASLLDADFWAGRRVAVGGGAGFLGSYVVPELVTLGAHVTVIDDLRNSDLENLAGVSSRIAVDVADLRDAVVCDRVTRGQDVFLNLAGSAFGMGYSRTHRSAMLFENVLVGLQPMDAARRHHVGRYTVVSSSCVYPDEAPVPTPELPPVTGWPERVNEGYGWAKRVQELAASYYVREHAMKIAVVRPCNLYGGNYRWRGDEKASLVPSLVKRILDGEDPLVVWGSGNQTRNLLHASDAARLILRVTERSTSGEPVNVAYDNETTVAELVRIICEATGRRPRIVFDPSKPEGAARKSADPMRLRALTNDYEPRISLPDGIQDMVAWYDRTFCQAKTFPVS
jgi:nucleoside-diphosphate-sugar epimerase